MLNSISMVSTSQDEMTSPNQALSWDATTSVNGIHAQAHGLRTALKKPFNFFTELKRRKVYKVATAYAVVSWLLIQAASAFGFVLSAIPFWMATSVIQR